MIDYESTSFGFIRRRDLVKLLTAARTSVAQRVAHPGHESRTNLDKLLVALDDVLNDEVFAVHVNPPAAGEHVKPNAKT